MAKLLTSHEDAAIGHFHALIGVINLLVYTWRLNVLGGGDMDCGFGQELRLDLMSLILMHVPVENKGDNVTIWKEYRWHNLIFVLQSTILLAVNVYEMHYPHIDRQLLWIGKASLVAVRFILMALATHWNPPKFTSTIRGAYKDAPAIVRFGLSYAQFAATSIVLCWEISTVMHLIVVAGLQINSFCMTLRKKGKIGTTLFLGIYTGLVSTLVLFAFLPPFQESALEGVLDERLKPFYMGLLTFWIRRQGVNRFVCWIIGPCATEFVFRSATTTHWQSLS